MTAKRQEQIKRAKAYMKTLDRSCLQDMKKRDARERRERLALIALQGLLSSEHSDSTISATTLAEESVMIADALIKALT